MAGAEPGRVVLEEVREAVPAEVPVLLNTGARADTIADYLQVADGCIVGSDLKIDGYTWNPVDRDRAMRFIDNARGVGIA
jgi:predicted TIM-barrel enzyme